MPNPSTSASPLSLIFRGEKEMTRKILRAAEDIRRRAAQALRLEAEAVRKEAIRKTVPRDLGELANSLYVEEPQVTTSSVTVKIGAGGPAAPYATAIHEHPSPSSPPSWQGKSIGDIHGVRTGEPWSLEGRGPKFLERPLRERLKGMKERIAEKIRSKGTGSGSGE